MNQPSNISEAAQTHPCGGCRHLHYVTASAYGSSRNGWGCLYTGGHAVKRCPGYSALDSTHPAPKEGEDRIGGFRITPDGFKMNGPTPPTKEETAAYLAHEKTDLLASIEALELRLAEKTRRLQQAEELLREAHEALDSLKSDAETRDDVMLNHSLPRAEETAARIATFLNSKTP